MGYKDKIYNDELKLGALKTNLVTGGPSPDKSHQELPAFLLYSSTALLFFVSGEFDLRGKAGLLLA